MWRIWLAARRAQAKIPGAAGVLAAYETARRGDVLTRMAAADLLNRTLVSGLLPLQLARGAGLMALSMFAPLRRAAMRPRHVWAAPVKMMPLGPP